MKVEWRQDEPGVCTVHSKGQEYYVDLYENDGVGVCACMDYWTRCLQNQKKNKGMIVDYGTMTKPNKRRSFCKHIKFARWDYLNHHLKHMHDKYRGKP